MVFCCFVGGLKVSRCFAGIHLHASGYTGINERMGFGEVGEAFLYE